jgi:hypothetical protein
MTDDEITTIACSHCKYVHEGTYRITQFESKSTLVAFARECIERAAPPAAAEPVALDAARLAKLRSSAQGALDTFAMVCSYCDSTDIGPTVAEEIESACDELRAALSTTAGRTA